MEIRRVYVAGPYTQGDVVRNVRAAIHAADKLLDAGVIPYLPHLTHFWHMVSPRQYEDWMKLDITWLMQCHAILLLPGLSLGVDVEAAKAREKGLPIFKDVDQVIAWAYGR